MEVKVGDTIEVHSVQVGQRARRGEVVEVVAEEPLELRVRWEDDHESTLYPHGGMVKVVAGA